MVLLEKTMTLNTTISDVLKVKFWIHNIPFTLLEKNDESYSLIYQDKRYKFNINLTETSFHFIENSRLNKTKQKIRNRIPFYISRNDDQTIDLGIQLNASRIMDHDFTQGPLLLKKDYADRGSYHIEISGTPVDLLAKIQQAQEQHIRKSEKIESPKENKGASNSQDIDLKSKGIYLAHPNAYKRCENCANNNGYKCSVHNTEVSDNHRCSRFYSYKTVYGGGFSPR